MKKIIGISAILVSMMMMLAMTASAESDSSRINRERKAIGRELIEVQSTNWPAVLQYYTQDIEYHDPIVDIQGLDVMAEFLGRLFASSPDLVTTIEDETCINGIYSAAWTMVGYFNDVPYTAAGMSITRRKGLVGDSVKKTVVLSRMAASNFPTSAASITDVSTPMRSRYWRMNWRVRR